MPTLTNVWEIRLNGKSSPTGETPKAVHNIFHYSIGPTTTTPPANSLLAAAFQGTVVTNLLSQVTADYTCIDMRIRLMDQYTNQETIHPVNVLGSKSPDRLPLFATVVHIMRTSYRGRSYLGRKMWSCIPEADTDHDQLSAAGQAAWAGMTGALGVSLPVGGFNAFPVILARSQCQLLSDPILLIGAPVTNVTLNVVLGTLRKRKEKVSA